MRAKIFRRYPVFAFTACFFALPMASNALMPAQQKANRIEEITLQYRNRYDAPITSGFCVVKEKSATGRLFIKWDLPIAAKKEKEAFDTLIKHLDEQGPNGVEFRCLGEWLYPYTSLRITTVPKLTKNGGKDLSTWSKPQLPRQIVDDPGAPTMNVILVWRGKLDAPTGGGFCVVGPRAINVRWELPNTLTKEKQAFDGLIDTLEKMGGNGVEFRCTAQSVNWNEIYVFTVPCLTVEGWYRLLEMTRGRTAEQTKYLQQWMPEALKSLPRKSP